MALPGKMPENFETCMKPNQFKKGHPGGRRPKGARSLTTVLRELLDTKVTRKNLDGEDQKDTVRQHLNLALLAKALKGDTRAIEQVYERMDGKVAEKQEITHDLSRAHEIAETIKIEDY